MPHQLAVIGAGVMAEAIVRGILSGKAIPPDQIIAADISPERRQLFQATLGIAAVESPASAVAGAKTVLLCVKPYQMESVLKSIAGAIDENALVISIAAGISSEFIENILGAGKPLRVIRAMPNTPMLVGKGMVALARGRNAGPADFSAARRLFESAAKVVEVSPDKMDAVTAISGSGPAYFFYLVEQLIRSGVELGLTELESQTLVLQTAQGAIEMLARSSDSPADQRKKVTTPNGTTHAAISHLESRKWDQATVDAVKAAAQRSRELGK
ncbi:MAG: pyrroline-5-carboxylate reductase [Tepidisphaeraceae bacterium]|jgi:pyrroline-5-carboxylate reductase